MVGVDVGVDVIDSVVADVDGEIVDVVVVVIGVVDVVDVVG